MIFYSYDPDYDFERLYEFCLTSQPSSSAFPILPRERSECEQLLHAAEGRGDHLILFEDEQTEDLIGWIWIEKRKNQPCINALQANVHEQRERLVVAMVKMALRETADKRNSASFTLPADEKAMITLLEASFRCMKETNSKGVTLLISAP